MRLTLITPHVGRKADGRYLRSWQMEPLPLLTLAGMTPAHWEVTLQDERIQPLDFDQPADLVGICTETFTAKRAYEIAAEYHRRGVPVVLGGYHPTLIPEEAVRYADAIVVGYAEDIWEQVLNDCEKGKLQRVYRRDSALPMRFTQPLRSLIQKRHYFKISCVETGRGCPHRCNFCAISAATGARYHPRPIDEILADLETCRGVVFFIDDNITGNFVHAKQLFRELRGRNVQWVSQGALNMTRDEELVSLMAESGCMGLLIGFESLNPETLAAMGKQVNLSSGSVPDAVRMLHDHGLSLYGTFLYGYDTDDPETWRQTVEEAIDLDLFIAAFNPLIPFPGTRLYQALSEAGRLADQSWWLNPEHRFNEAPFAQSSLTQPAIRQICLEARRRFYSLTSIVERLSLKGPNASSLKKLFAYLSINMLMRREISQRDALPLGNGPHRPTPLFEPLDAAVYS